MRLRFLCLLLALHLASVYASVVGPGLAPVGDSRAEASDAALPGQPGRIGARLLQPEGRGVPAPVHPAWALVQHEGNAPPPAAARAAVPPAASHVPGRDPFHPKTARGPPPGVLRAV
jgi:hypothetical protein